MITCPAEPLHAPADLGPAFTDVGDPLLLHRAIEHQLHDEICVLDASVKAFFRRLHPGSQNLLPIDRVLEILQRGWMVVRVGHNRSLTGRHPRGNLVEFGEADFRSHLRLPDSRIASPNEKSTCQQALAPVANRPRARFAALDSRV